ncbi:hypothetical protein GCM10010345_53650 [Streptomyces canarius]|uniref:Uncharacterized protein n=1 Tax=Streptomyces canarius TaxID=285453 RepID=A0ABQ3CV75_9ACTN|nr:hypothetical protein GCM10010345_53650 [Streptomyces canarius]
MEAHPAGTAAGDLSEGAEEAQEEERDGAPVVHLRRPGPLSSPDPACGDTPPSYASYARAVGPNPME